MRSVLASTCLQRSVSTLYKEIRCTAGQYAYWPIRILLASLFGSLHFIGLGLSRVLCLVVALSERASRASAASRRVSEPTRHVNAPSAHCNSENYSSTSRRCASARTVCVHALTGVALVFRPISVLRQTRKTTPPESNVA